MNLTAYYPGSFDPLTHGHVDILRQALNIAEQVVVGIGIHPGKQPMFNFDERATMINEVVANLDVGGRIKVESFNNLVVDAAREAGASLLVRGVRDGSDLDYELQMAGMNGAMSPEIDTVFFAAQPKNRAITATLVRQIAKMGGNTSAFVPESVHTVLKKRFK